MTNEELIEIKDHINYLDDIRKAISLQKKDNDAFKNLDFNMETLDDILKNGWGQIKD